MASMDFVDDPNLPVSRDLQSFLSTHPSHLCSACAVSAELAHETEISLESVRIQRREIGLHFSNAIPDAPLSDAAKATRVQFCRERLATVRPPTMVFVDETTVGQDGEIGTQTLAE
jgi:hypothetical protein